MERRVRILVTLGMIAALAGLMLISVEPEVDLSVDQLMDSPGEYEGESLDLAYNAQYLIEILRKMGAGNAVFDLKDSVTAAVVRPSVQAEGEESYYLLMPMRPSS